jgi:hypothetical protein
VSTSHTSVSSWRTDPFARLESLGARVARRKGLVLLLVATFPLVLRTSLLRIDPIPVPVVHDEFSYLLAGDTFAHGRITNPTHAVWVFLDTIHVNQRPTYMSKYPPAQGAFLAVGQKFGNPWIGVLLSVAAMCAAVVWMLQEWLPPEWALLGGFLFVLRLSAFNYWIDSYWGGAVAAMGGALVMGALPRLFHHRRVRYALVLGAGLVILANSRPVEGLIFSLPVVFVLAAWLFKAPMPWTSKFSEFVLPLALVLIVSLAFMGYYNWRGTGRPTLFPYMLFQEAHFASPPVVFLPLPAPRKFLNPQFTDFSNQQRAEYLECREHFLRTTWTRVTKLRTFFGSTWLVMPLLTLPWLVRDRRIRLLWIQLLVSGVGVLVVVAFFVHYAAPLTATIFALTMQGMRHLRRWKCRGQVLGIWITRAIVAICILIALGHIARTWMHVRQGTLTMNAEYTPARLAMLARDRIAHQLSGLTGKHLVIVQYAADHDVRAEWVYNGAEIDTGKTVWARDIPGQDLTPLLDYFRDRTAWVVHADAIPPKLETYRGQTQTRTISSGNQR